MVFLLHRAMHISVMHYNRAGSFGAAKYRICVIARYVHAFSCCSEIHYEFYKIIILCYNIIAHLIATFGEMFTASIYHTLTLPLYRSAYSRPNWKQFFFLRGGWFSGYMKYYSFFFYENTFYIYSRFIVKYDDEFYNL